MVCGRLARSSRPFSDPLVPIAARSSCLSAVVVTVIDAVVVALDGRNSSSSRTQQRRGGGGGVSSSECRSWQGKRAARRIFLIGLFTRRLLIMGSRSKAPLSDHCVSGSTYTQQYAPCPCSRLVLSKLFFFASEDDPFDTRCRGEMPTPIPLRHPPPREVFSFKTVPRPLFRGFSLERFFVYSAYYCLSVSSRAGLRIPSQNVCLCLFICLLILLCVYIVCCLCGLRRALVAPCSSPLTHEPQLPVRDDDDDDYAAGDDDLWGARTKLK